VQDGFRVGDSHHVDPSLNTVKGARGTIRLEPKVMQVLLCLVEHTGRMVPKDRLMRGAVTNADWWATVRRPARQDEYPRRPASRMWTLRKGSHEAALDLRSVQAMGPELVLSIDGEPRRSRLYRLDQGYALSRSIFALRAVLQAKGWAA